MVEMNQFQKNILFFLEKNELSETKLAKKIGVSQKAISRYINNGSSPKPDVLIALAKEFKCSVEDLWTYDFENQLPNHPRSYARKPDATDTEFSYFEGKKLFVYYLQGETDQEMYDGVISLDREYDSERVYLHGHAITGHNYDVKLIIDSHINKSVFIFGSSIDDGRRFYIALHYPDFRNEEEYKGGVGVLTRLDTANVFVAQRVVLSDNKLEIEDRHIKERLLSLLSDNGKYPSIQVDARVNERFRSGHWMTD